MVSQKTKKGIFVSFHNSQSETELYEILHLLKMFSPDIFLSTDKEQSRYSVSLFSDEIYEDINICHAFILIIGENWLKAADEFGRRFIDDPKTKLRREIDLAVSNKIDIIPVIFGGQSMPPAIALPDELQFLTEKNFIRQTNDNSWLEKLNSIINQSRNGRLLEYNLGENASKFEFLKLELINFKCFEHFELNLEGNSILEGNWTCIAGINGAGKSSILQAMALLLMGPRKAREIGGKRIDNFRRISDTQKQQISTIRGQVRVLGNIFHLEITIGFEGIDYKEEDFWMFHNDAMFVGYGANRNISTSSYKQESDLSDSVERFMSLFDPMAKLNSAESIFRNIAYQTKDELERDVFLNLLEIALPEEVTVRSDEHPVNEMEFRTGESFHSAVELPDGFRSTIAWLADLSIRIVDTYQGQLPIKLAEQSGIVLIDEIELHLHASLQRSIISRLRKALPKLQWIITTHSPLVIASFDQNELVPLDNETETGIRKVDRQILGLTADQVYEQFFGTPASSEAAEEFLQRESSSGIRRQEYDSIIGSYSSTLDEEEMKDIQDRIRKLKI